MDDGTREPKFCSVCGDPLRPDNSIGICANSANPECAKARRRAYRQRRPGSADQAPAARKQCEICGKPLNANNRSGLCDGKASEPCRLERTRRNTEWAAAQRAKTPKPGWQHCDVCGTRLNRNNTMGVCGDPWKPACRAERKRRKQDGMVPGRTGPAITEGETFGKWTVLETSRVETAFIPCRCECGTERRVFGRNLVLGLSWECGCTRMLAAAARRWPDPYMVAGSAFGRLTVLDDVHRSYDGARCLCECGTETFIAFAANLKDGSTRSCGCLRLEAITTHGLSAHPLYTTWKSMIHRCTNPKTAGFINYGGRKVPIRVCERWLDVAVFIEDILREIGPRPEGKTDSGAPLYTIDRKNNEGHYEPGNVKWSTQSEQVINQRKVGPLTDQRDAATLALEATAAERDAALAEVERLTQLLASRSRKPALPAQDALF